MNWADWRTVAWEPQRNPVNEGVQLCRDALTVT